jgi:tetratricopeptide (TPR) repeat protein
MMNVHASCSSHDLSSNFIAQPGRSTLDFKRYCSKQRPVVIPNNPIEAAEALLRAGDAAAAAELLAPLAAAETVDALRLLALCQLRLNAPQLALELFGRAQKLAPRDPLVALHAGIGLAAVGRHAEAAALFRQAARGLPNDPAPELQLSTSLLAQGDFAGAIAAARKGRLRAPRAPQPNYVLGLAYLNAGFLDKAAACFKTAIQHQPNFVDAWINLGVAQYRMGEIFPARETMRAARRAAPDDAAVAANLGAFLRLTGDLAGGEAVLRAVIESHPGATPARLSLAGDLLREDRAADALALLDGAPKLTGLLHQQWALQRILALLKLGRVTEAATMLSDPPEMAPALAPLLTWRFVLLDEAAGLVARAERAAEDMEAALPSAPLLPEHRVTAHFDLAGFWSRRHAPDRAFPHWRQAHRRLAASQPFARAAEAAFVDASIAGFDAARLAGPRASNPDAAPVFIVGLPHSGTDRVAQILGSHGQVHNAGASTALGEAFWALGGHDSPAGVRRAAAQPQGALDEHAARYLAGPGAPRTLDSAAQNFRHLGLMALLLPGARVIACEADPRDTGFSIFSRPPPGLHPYAHDLADLGWYIGQHRRLMAHWRAVLPNPILTLQAADWDADFAGTLRRVLAFLDLPHDPACVPPAPARPEVIGTWRDYETHLGPLLAALQ